MDHLVIPTPLGDALATSQNDRLTGLWLPGQKWPVLPREGCGKDPVLLRTKAWLDAYFRGDRPELEIPLDPRGTAFQRRVWDLLTKIPYGESTTYGALAVQLGIQSAQAVGQAVGANPISILIPCHRVLGSGGKLTGYAGGLDKKIFLLDLERIPYK